MAQVVIMPKQGQSVESCIVSEFKVKVGDVVKAGDILFGYETDKATFEEESKFDGTVLAIFWKDGDEIPCLENVLVIGEPGESFEEFAPKGDTPSAPEAVSSETVAARPLPEGPLPLTQPRVAWSPEPSLLQDATPEPYNRLAHLFRFHSWAPVYIDYNAVANMSFEDITTTAGIGASAFFQNHLGTMTGIVAYNADPGDGRWTHKAETKFTYSGIYPVIEAGL